MVKKIKRFIKNSYIYLRDFLLEKKLKKGLQRGGEIKIIIGASGETFFSTVSQKGWLATNIGFLDITEESSFEKYFTKNSISAMLAEHVWEHMTLDQGRQAAKNCYAFLKPGGSIRIAVPDGGNPDPEFIKFVDINGTGPGAEDHKILYTAQSLSKVFETAGFTIHLLEYFDTAGVSRKNPWDQLRGMINRSLPEYTSIILDAVK